MICDACTPYICRMGNEHRYHAELKMSRFAELKFGIKTRFLPFSLSRQRSTVWGNPLLDAVLIEPHCPLKVRASTTKTGSQTRHWINAYITLWNWEIWQDIWDRRISRIVLYSSTSQIYEIVGTLILFVYLFISSKPQKIEKKKRFVQFEKIQYRPFTSVLSILLLL